jgi:hypothetical protein
MAERREENSSENSHHGTSEQRGGHPLRCFTCRFCRREFRNAQALGGHMNVHREERKRARDGARDLLQLRHHGSEPNEPPSDTPPLQRPRSQDEITKSTHNLQGDRLRSGTTSPPPSQQCILVANNSLSNLLRHDSANPTVDLELRLGHSTPDM